MGDVISVASNLAPRRTAEFAELDDRLPFLGSLQICRGRIKTRRRVVAPQYVVGVAVFDGATLIGSCTYSESYIHPDYRGRGMGAELMAERRLAFAEFCLASITKVRAPLSAAGVRTKRAAYRLMVERGAITPPSP